MHILIYDVYQSALVLRPGSAAIVPVVSAAGPALDWRRGIPMATGAPVHSRDDDQVFQAKMITDSVDRDQIGANLRVCADEKDRAEFRSAQPIVNDWNGWFVIEIRRRRWLGGRGSYC
jgi:hypothetical protein